MSRKWKGVYAALDNLYPKVALAEENKVNLKDYIKVDNEEKFVQNENENEGQEENIKEDSDIPRVFADCEINKIPKEEIEDISRKDESACYNMQGNPSNTQALRATDKKE